MLNNLVWTCQQWELLQLQRQHLMDNVGGGSGCFLKLLLPGQKEFALWIEVAAWMTRVLTPQPNHRHPVYSLECRISAWKLCQNPASRDSFNHVVTTQLCNLLGWGYGVWYGDGSISLHLNVIFSSEQMDGLLCGDCYKHSKNSDFWQAEAV